MAEELPAFEDECFFIAPIGDDGSDVRKRSDAVLQFIVERAAEEVGLKAVRADRISKPGSITLQVVEHVLQARAAVVDLTGINPNVFYELGIRHAARLPTVLICEAGQGLPFDIGQMRTIFFDHKDLKSADDCRVRVANQLKEALAGAVDSPVAASVDLAALQTGSPLERQVAELVDIVAEVHRTVRSIEHGRPIDKYMRLFRDRPAATTTGEHSDRLLSMRDMDTLLGLLREEERVRQQLLTDPPDDDGDRAKDAPLE